MEFQLTDGGRFCLHSLVAKMLCGTVRNWLDVHQDCLTKDGYYMSLAVRQWQNFKSMPLPLE